MLQTPLSPESAVDALIDLHRQAVGSLKTCLERYFTTRQPPSSAERQFLLPRACRPLRVARHPAVHLARLCQVPGPRHLCDDRHPAGPFPSLSDRTARLSGTDYGATIEVRRATRKSPTLTFSKGRRPGRRQHQRRRTGPPFPGAAPALVGDEIADGTWDDAGQPLPLALFDAARVDYSLKRIQHYTGTHWRTSSRGSCSPTITAMSTSS